jgi:hypothetical protein
MIFNRKIIIFLFFFFFNFLIFAISFYILFTKFELLIFIQENNINIIK